MREDEHVDHSLKTLLEKKFHHLVSPLESFILKQTTAGALLIIFSSFALVIMNTPWAHLLKNLSQTELGIVLAGHRFSLSLGDWVGQGLMAMFFFLTGLEVKREILAGKLRQRKEVILVCLAALGGILVPALFYYLFNQDGVGQHGWGIPTATDTAFVIAVLALMARRVSVSMTIFLTALAIFDDIGSMAVISIFYAHNMEILALCATGLILVLLFLANRLGIRSGWFYAISGMLLWLMVFKAGLHATFAGLLLALSVPARTTLSQSAFIKNIRNLLLRFEQRQDRDVSMLQSSGQHSIVSDIASHAQNASTPLQRWEDKFAAPIAIIVLPLFALLNAGFEMSDGMIAQSLDSSVFMGIIAGLVIGKPVGILLFIFLGIKAGIGQLPEGMNKREVVGVAFLAGIGFTMSIFFTTLSFPPGSELLDLAKFGILVSSVLSALLGILWINHMPMEKK